MIRRDGHIRVLPLHVANKIAAGEVVERPASVVKELVENAIDAGAKTIRITITQGGRKLVAVQDDGCGMTKDDAVLSLERQATSKILDVNDIEEIDTLGFRGEAIPSIASVSRFTITTRRHESDEGTLVQVNAGQLAEVRAAGCPPGTLVEVRDLFCNVPARRKFLRAFTTEENHVKQVFSVHALAHPTIGFSLTVDGRELYRLAPAASLADRVLDLFGKDFVAELLPIAEVAAPPGRRGAIAALPDQGSHPSPIRVTGFIERPNLNQPTRREQFVFVNGRPATAPSIAYALREAYPRRQGEVRPAVVLFIDLPPNQVDVNVHPTKREVRFRDNNAVKQAIITALETALKPRPNTPAALEQSVRGRLAPAVEATENDATGERDATENDATGERDATENDATEERDATENDATEERDATRASRLPTSVDTTPSTGDTTPPSGDATPPLGDATPSSRCPPSPPAPAPVQIEFAVEPDSTDSRPWKWFTFLAQTSSGYVLLETDAGLVTLNPRAARERIVYERLLDESASQTRNDGVAASTPPLSQSLLIPEIVQLSPTDAARIRAALPAIRSMGFALEEFGKDVFKIEALPQLVGAASPAALLSTIARDFAEAGARRGGERWREELIAKAVARTFAGNDLRLTEETAKQLVEDLCRCRMPYICPRGKITMTLTSERELNRKFGRS